MLRGHSGRCSLDRGHGRAVFPAVTGQLRRLSLHTRQGLVWFTRAVQWTVVHADPTAARGAWACPSAPSAWTRSPSRGPERPPAWPQGLCPLPTPSLQERDPHGDAHTQHVGNTLCFQWSANRTGSECSKPKPQMNKNQSGITEPAGGSSEDVVTLWIVPGR